MQLILQPCSDSDAREHFVDTIENPVPLSRILPFLDPDQQAAVQATFSDSVAVWGVTPGKKNVNAKKWQRMSVGDCAMLYRNKQFFFRGSVAYKLHNEALAAELWNRKDDGSTWEYMFFLSDLEPVEIPIDRFNRAAGYKENNIIHRRTQNASSKLWISTLGSAPVSLPMKMSKARGTNSRLSVVSLMSPPRHYVGQNSRTSVACCWEGERQKFVRCATEGFL